MIAGLAALVLLSSVPLFMVANKNFLPDDDQSEFEVGLRAPEGSSLEATEIIANRVAARVRQIPEVEFTLVSVADDPARTQNLGSIYVRLKPVDERDRDQFEVMNEVRDAVIPPDRRRESADRCACRSRRSAAAAIRTPRSSSRSTVRT